MKTLLLSISEFLHFRQVAEKFRINFTHGIVKNGEVKVNANAADLEIIGY